MKKLLFPNKLVSATLLLSFGMLSTGFMPALAVEAEEGAGLEFIPVVVRAESAADYGASDTKLVISPVQPAAILAVLTDNNGEEAGTQIFERVEQQLDQDDPADNETSDDGAGQSVSGNTPASQNEPNTDQIPGNGNAYGLGNGNGNGPANNNGNGPGNNNGNGPGNNNGNGNVNANANAGGAVGLGLTANSDEISIDINVGNGNGQGLGLGLNKDEDNSNNGNSKGQGNGNGNNILNNGNGNGNN